MLLRCYFLAVSHATFSRRVFQVITFIDLAGHEKYLKTTVFGLTGHAPDFAMLMIGSNMGIVGMTKGTVLSYYSFFTHCFR